MMSTICKIQRTPIIALGLKHGIFHGILRCAIETSRDLLRFAVVSLCFLLPSSLVGRRSAQKSLDRNFKRCVLMIMFEYQTIMEESCSIVNSLKRHLATSYLHPGGGGWIGLDERMGTPTCYATLCSSTRLSAYHLKIESRPVL